MPSAVIIKPDRSVFNSPLWKQAVEDALDVTALAAQSNFETTTRTWDHDVSFTISTKPGERIVSTDDEIYRYVNDGTRRHLIGPRRTRYLRFMTPFRAKTVPGQLGAGSGSKGQNVVFTRKIIDHPGTKPRRFAKLVAKQAQSRLLLEIHTRFADLAKK